MFKSERGAISTKPSVIIYRRSYLPPSETFIVDHIDTLQRWRPVPAYETEVSGGLRSNRHPSYSLLSDRIFMRRADGFLLSEFGLNHRLAQLVRQHHPQLMHAHFLVDAARIAKAAHYLRIPLLATAHGYDATIYEDEWRRSWQGRIYLRQLAFLKRSSAIILCVSDFIRAQLSERGFAEKNLRTVRLGVDLEAFRPADDFTTRKGVLFVGRLVEKKGVEWLLRAWARLSPVLQTSRLTIIGEGPKLDELRQGQSDDTVRFLGRQSRDAIRAAMLTHAVIVIPSVRASNGDAEGLPIVAMEAQASGLPVIAFDDPPFGEAVLPGSSGLLVRSCDVDALAAAMTKIMGEPGLAMALSRGARTLALERFDIQKTIRVIEQIYDEVALQKSP